MSKFRLKLKDENTKPEPVKGPDERPNKEGAPGTKGEKEWKEQGIPKKCHAFLEAFDANPLEKNTYHGTLDNYVVIGRGFAATVNLATLRTKEAKERTSFRGKKCELVVIGPNDPWAKYVDHNMNQEVELLTLPGYKVRPNLPLEEASRWLRSRDFSAKNGAELNRGISGGEWPFSATRLISTPVTYIEIRPTKTKRICVNLADGSSLTAKKLDICTGTGQQTYIEPGDKGYGVLMPDELWDEYLSPTARPIEREGKRFGRVFSAEMYVTGERQVIPGGAVLIAGANNPAGIQAGEHALCEDGDHDTSNAAGEVVLNARRKINEGFLPIGRLDELARTSLDPLPRRLHVPKEDLFPTRRSMWFAEGLRVKSVEVLSEEHLDLLKHGDGEEIDVAGVGVKLLVTFDKGDAAERVVRGMPLGTFPDVPEAPLVYGLFDQVVFSTGRARGATKEQDPPQEGSALALVKSVGKLVPIVKEGYEFPVGLVTEDGRIRILGAAGINNPVFKADGLATKLKEFEDSLPVQARVNGEGVTLAAVTIAIANEFFKLDEDNLNRCLNTATLPELEKLLGKEPARRIYLMRHWRVSPLRARKEVVRAVEYWAEFLREKPAKRLQEATFELAKSLEYWASPFVREVNDTAYLLAEDLAWEEMTKKYSSWEAAGFTEVDLQKALLRYAEHIENPETRAKVLTQD